VLFILNVQDLSSTVEKIAGPTKVDNPQKLATWGAQAEDKQTKGTT
jgi:hypothetical protein